MDLELKIVGIVENSSEFLFLISVFFFFLKITSVEDDGSIGVKFFNYVREKGYRMSDLEYTISRTDVAKVIQPPVIRHISKSRGWVIFKEDLNVSTESYSDFSI